jgi:hypothetical protein
MLEHPPRLGWRSRARTRLVARDVFHSYVGAVHRALFVLRSASGIEQTARFVGTFTFAVFMALLEERQHFWVDFDGDALFLADHGFSVAQMLFMS